MRLSPSVCSICTGGSNWIFLWRLCPAGGVFKELFRLIRRDPYIYHHRQRLYPILSTFRTDHESRLWNRPITVGDKIRELVVSPLIDLLSGFFMLRTDSASTMDLLDLIKYGLPSTENLLIHKDYIVSQDMCTNSPRWICEHFRGNYQKIETDSSGDSSLNLRNNDVYVLSGGSMKICKAFKGKIWNDLEQYVVTKAQEFGSVYTYTGPIYMPSSQDDDKWSLKYEVNDWIPMPVPSHYFKVLIVESNIPGIYTFIEGFIIENSRSMGGKLRNHRVKVDEIERFTGLRFNKDLRPAVQFDKNKFRVNTQAWAGRFQEISEQLTAQPSNKIKI
ncbi:endonuclease G, mitochondrial [Drosophila serrata]|uniref:endonuclease G, mitochondrial n=1 Tax=Drosophila serrata TaxID=7274 RepID=UPI000A1D0F4F|nr:endonuclease G, mitochondrial [Drosophila serrata]